MSHVDSTSFAAYSHVSRGAKFSDAIINDRIITDNK
jgi:hypothetical protein